MIRWSDPFLRLINLKSWKLWRSENRRPWRLSDLMRMNGSDDVEVHLNASAAAALSVNFDPLAVFHLQTESSSWWKLQRFLRLPPEFISSAAPLTLRSECEEFAVGIWMMQVDLSFSSDGYSCACGSRLQEKGAIFIRQPFADFNCDH